MVDRMLALMLLGLLALGLHPVPATAHKVIGMAYADGARIEGEIGFSNGDPAETGKTVTVYGPDGSVLGSTVIEEGGLFSFTAAKRIDHRFVADLGAGHVADILLPGAELPASLGRERPAGPAGGAPADAAQPLPNTRPLPGWTEDEIKAMISSAVAKEVRPLRRELMAFQERATWQDAIGGIGAILGFFGIAAYAAVLRRRRPS